MIPVYIVAGLLDSGKTSFIKSTLLQQDWLNKGHTPVLMCESGEVEFTDEEKRQYDLIPIEIPEAETFSLSFCEELTRSADPAQIIIEFNGMWSLQDFLKREFPKNWGLAGIYSTVNGEDLELVMTNMRNLFMNQHIESDLIVVNRCRPEMTRGTFRKAIKLQNPAAQSVSLLVQGQALDPQAAFPVPGDLRRGGEIALAQAEPGNGSVPPEGRLAKLHGLLRKEPELELLQGVAV